jgi:hypothetical protein
MLTRQVAREEEAVRPAQNRFAQLLAASGSRTHPPEQSAECGCSRIADEHVDDPGASIGVTSTHDSRRFLTDLPDPDRVTAELVPCARSRRVRSSAGDDSDEFPFVRHVERVDAQQARTRGATGGRTGSDASSKHDSEIGVAGEFVADRADAPRVASRSQRVDWRGGQQAFHQARASGAVSDTMSASSAKVAARLHHRHAVVTDRSRHQHDIALP